MEIIACPRCGSRRIYQGTISDGVLTGYTSRFVCKHCHYQGMPLIFSSEIDYDQFLKEHLNMRNFHETTIPKNESNVKNIVTQRPKGILILSMILIIQSMLIVFLLYTDIIPSLFSDTRILFYLISITFLQLIVAYGLIIGKHWAYLFAGIVFVLMMPIGLIYLYYLTTKNVKAYFHIDI